MFGNISSGYKEANESGLWLQRNQNAQNMLREELGTDRTEQYNTDLNAMASKVPEAGSISAEGGQQMNLQQLIGDAGVSDSTSLLLPMDEIKQ
jgi:hypothetical protein